MKRKFLALLLAFVMVVGMLPVSAFADGEGETTVAPDANGNVSVSTEAQLNAALSANTTGVKTITLTADITLTGIVSVDKNAVIDFGGHTVTGAENTGCFDLAYVIPSSTLELKNGTLSSASWAVWVQSGGQLTIAENMTVGTTTTNAAKPAITVQDTGSTVIVNGTVTSVDSTAISGIGNADDGGVVITVGASGKVESTNEAGSIIPIPVP